MAICEVCGKSFQAGRSDAKTCSGKCRTAASRRRAAALKKSQELMMTLEGAALLQKLRAIAPAAAASVEKLIEVHGVGCTEAAVKVALNALTEASASKVSRRKVS